MGLGQHFGCHVPLDSLHVVLVKEVLHSLVQYAGGNARILIVGGEEYILPPGVIPDIINYEDQIRSALRSNDWSSIKMLPRPIWGCITSITHLTCKQWEMLPDAVRSVLSAGVFCPECGASGPFEEVVRLHDSERDLSFNGKYGCKNCGQLVRFDYREKCLVPVKSRIKVYYYAFGSIALLASCWLLYNLARNLYYYSCSLH